MLDAFSEAGATGNRLGGSSVDGTGVLAFGVFMIGLRCIGENGLHSLDVR